MAWKAIADTGLWVFEPRVFGDSRGYFLESYQKENMPEPLRKIDFIQDNEAKSSYGVLRGLHYQLPPYSQSKLVRVVTGEVLDVVVDVRPESDTYGQCFSFLLNDENKRQLFVPKGFAHGYAVLSDEAIFVYKCDAYYKPDAEAGLRYDDPSFNIDWKIDKNKVTVSDRDKNWPDFGCHKIFRHD